MKIETVFDIGDKVFFVDRDEVRTGIINGIYTNGKVTKYYLEGNGACAFTEDKLEYSYDLAQATIDHAKMHEARAALEALGYNVTLT